MQPLNCGFHLKSALAGSGLAKMDASAGFDWDWDGGGAEAEAEEERAKG